MSVATADKGEAAVVRSSELDIRGIILGSNDWPRAEWGPTNETGRQEHMAMPRQISPRLILVTSRRARALLCRVPINFSDEDAQNLVSVDRALLSKREG